MTTGKMNRRVVYKKQVKEILRDPLWAKDNEQSKPFLGEVYFHPDDRALTVFPSDGHGVLYATRADFEIMAGLLKRPREKPRHILYGLVPNDDTFALRVPQLVNDLSIILKISREQLDNSLSSLELVERKVKHLGRTKCLAPPVFQAIVAYTGEVIREAIMGRWEMLLNHGTHGADDFWEPWLVDAQGRSANSFDYLYDMLSDPKVPISIRSTTAMTIGSARVRKPYSPDSKFAGNTIVFVAKQKDDE